MTMFKLVACFFFLAFSFTSFGDIDKLFFRKKANLTFAIADIVSISSCEEATRETYAAVSSDDNDYPEIREKILKPLGFYFFNISGFKDDSLTLDSETFSFDKENKTRTTKLYKVYFNNSQECEEAYQKITSVEFGGNIQMGLFNKNFLPYVSNIVID